MTCTKCSGKKYRAVGFGESAFNSDTTEITVDGYFQFHIKNMSETNNIIINDHNVVEPGDTWGPPCNNVGYPFEGKVKIKFSGDSPDNKGVIHFIKGIECTTNH